MLSPGTKLGPYEVVALVGSGGMGEVYRARDARLGRDVAVKVVRGLMATDAERVRRFELEARSAGILNHPNVLAIYDVGTHEGAPYLVSELLEGETVRTRLGAGPIAPSKVLDYATQIAEGLAAAHAKGIVHRDLKPENVFVTRDGRVKILDFGLAKLTEPDNRLGTDSEASTEESAGHLVGTVSYMSPEQIRVAPLDHRSDIFALGTVLYEMLTGHRAFRGASPIETMNAALHGDPPDLLNLPPGLDLIVQHCLEKDPANRFQSAGDLAFHLKALASGTATGKRPPSLPRMARRRGSRRGLLLGAGVAALLLAGLALGLRLGRPVPPTFRQLTFRRGMLFSARFAPDGETVVYGAAWNGAPAQVFTMRPASPESRSLGLPDGDVLSISASGELAVSLGRRPTLGFETRGTLARVPLAGGAPREVLTDVESADWAPDGQSLAVVHVVQDRYQLEFPIGTPLYASAGWLSDVRIAPDGARIAFIEHPVRSDDRGDVCVMDRDGGHRRVLSGGWSSVTGVAWAHGGRELWHTAAAVGGGAVLYAVDLAGRRRLVAEMPGRLAIADVRGERALLTDGLFRLLVALRRQGDASGDHDLSWLDGSIGADLSDDGRLLLISEQSSGAGAESYAVYLRRTDGSPAIRLGDGLAQSLSPDGLFAASVRLDGVSRIVLLPTGPGANRTLPGGPVRSVEAVTWFPDGRHILFAGHEGSRPTRLYVQDIAGGGPRAISAEGIRIPFPCKAVSPDGASIAAVDREGRLVVQPVDGGAPRALAGPEPGDVPIRWNADGTALFVFRKRASPARVLRLDLKDGAMSDLAAITPTDPTGARPTIAVQMTPDASVYAYSYSQTLSELYLVEGLR